jgi:phosphoribosylaminoimidazole (AIR) synthetase
LKVLNDLPNAITGMAHITGGGLIENVPRVLPAGVCAEIDTAAWDLPPVFKWLIKNGDLKPSDMGMTLNAGIGMVVICEADKAAAVSASFKASGETVYEIGRITENAEPIVLLNADTSWA